MAGKVQIASRVSDYSLCMRYRREIYKVFGKMKIKDRGQI